MPVIRPANRKCPMATLAEQLTDVIVAELTGERRRLGPVIFEQPTGELNRIKVIVVWEAWKPLLFEERASVIRAAYARFTKTLENSIHPIDPSKENPCLVPIPVTVIGLCWEDLVGTDLLPYKIEPSAPANGVDPDDVETLKLLAGAIQTASGYQLLFPSKEMATEVHHQLMKQMPEAAWTILEVQ